MTLKYVANELLKVKLTAVVVPPGALYAGDPGIDTVKVVPTLAAKTKAEGKKVATDKIAITWTAATGNCPYSAAGYTFISGAATIPATATKTKAAGKAVLREGDQSIAGCVGSWAIDAGGSLVCSCSAEITDPGQGEVKAT